MPEIPDRLSIDKADRELYSKLDQEDLTRFRDNNGTRTRKEQFLLAMAYGFKSGARRPLETKEGFVLMENLQPEDEALMNAVALSDAESTDVLANREEVVRVAEEYAHAGIRLLVDWLESTEFGSFEKHFEKKVVDMIGELGLQK